MKNTPVVKKRIPYGIGDFELVRSKNMYYVDKTKIIQDLEYRTKSDRTVIKFVDFLGRNWFRRYETRNSVVRYSQYPILSMAY